MATERRSQLAMSICQSRINLIFGFLNKTMLQHELEIVRVKCATKIDMMLESDKYEQMLVIFW